METPLMHHSMRGQLDRLLVPYLEDPDQVIVELALMRYLKFDEHGHLTHEGVEEARAGLPAFDDWELLRVFTSPEQYAYTTALATMARNRHAIVEPVVVPELGYKYGFEEAGETLQSVKLKIGSFVHPEHKELALTSCGMWYLYSQGVQIICSKMYRALLSIVRDLARQAIEQERRKISALVVGHSPGIDILGCMVHNYNTLRQLMTPRLGRGQFFPLVFSVNKHPPFVLSKLPMEFGLPLDTKLRPLLESAS